MAFVLPLFVSNLSFLLVLWEGCGRFGYLHLHFRIILWGLLMLRLRIIYVLNSGKGLRFRTICY